MSSFRRSTVLLALLVLGGVLLTGCLGGNAPDLDPTAADENATDPEEAEPVEGAPGNASWTEDEWSGTVTSAHALLIAYNPEGSFVVEPSVEEGARTLFLNLSIEATAPTTEAEMLIGPPGCEVNDNDCEERVSTSDGTASWDAEDPEPGTWRVRVFKSGPGADRIDWTLSAAQHVDAQ